MASKPLSLFCVSVDLGLCRSSSLALWVQAVVEVCSLRLWSVPIPPLCLPIAGEAGFPHCLRDISSWGPYGFMPLVLLLSVSAWDVSGPHLEWTVYCCLFASPVSPLFALAPCSEVDLDRHVYNPAALQAWDGVCSNLGSFPFFVVYCCFGFCLTITLLPWNLLCRSVDLKFTEVCWPLPSGC